MHAPQIYPSRSDNALVLLLTRHALDGTALTAPFSWVIALNDIRRARRTEDRRPAPARSLKRLRIECGSGRVIMVPAAA
jgi:hypothetical protein